MADKKTTIVESAARGGMSAVLPYVVVIGGGLLAYKYLKDDIAAGFGNVTTNASRVIENISEKVTETINNTTEKVTETINNTTEKVTETINNTTENISNFVDDHTLNAAERKNIQLEAAAFAVGSAPGVKLPNLSKEQQDFISKYAVNTGVTSFRESPSLDFGLGSLDFGSLDFGLGPSMSPLEHSMLGLDDKSNNNISTGAAPKKSSTKTPTGPTGPTLTDSEVAALKSSGKKPVTGPNTTGKIRVLSRPDKFGNRYDITDISTSRGRYR